MSGTSIFNELKLISFEGMKLVEPALIQQGEGISAKFYKLNKYSEDYIYTGLEFKSKQSKELFKIDPSIWRTIISQKIEEQYRKSEDPDSCTFSLDSCKGILFRDTIIDVYRNDIFNGEKLEKFISDIIKFESNKELTATFNEFGNLNMVYKRGKGAVVVTLDFNKGKHKAYSGMNVDQETILLSQRPILESKSLSEFIILFMPEEQLSDSETISEHDSKDSYKLDVPLSLREIFDVIKATKCKVEIDEEGYAASFSGFTTKNSGKLVDFLMSFHCPYKTLKTLPLLRKSFKTWKITSGEMLKILTEELKSESLNVTADLIANISKTCDNNEFDKTVIEEETNGKEIEW